MDIFERYVTQEADEEQINGTQSTSNNQKKSTKSSTTSITKFLNSIGRKKSTSSSTIIKSTTKSKFNEELATYRILAQKEFNSITEDDKECNVVSAIQLN